MTSEPRGLRAHARGMRAFIGALCVMACLSGRARAQGEHVDDERVDATQSVQYRELIGQALDEFKRKNWPESRVLFRRAHAISPSARTQRGIGMVSYEMRDYPDAVVALSSALSDSRQALTDAQRSECENLLSRARTFVGTYVLTLEPAQANVMLDGAPLVREADGRVLVPFGSHTLRATADGYAESITRLSVQGGEQGELRVTLNRPDAVAQPSVVEKNVAVAPPTSLATEPEPRNDRFLGHGLRYSWIALGTTAALGAASAIVWFTGQHKVDDLNDKCGTQASLGTPCQRGTLDVSGPHRYEHATTALLGMTGAALVATGVLVSLEWPTEKRRRASRAPAHLALDVAPQRVSLRGSF